MILAYLGRTLKEYSENFLKFIENISFLCPICEAKTTYHAKYSRKLILFECVEKIIIQRVKCTECGKTHAIIPDFIRPFKHYAGEEIEKTVCEVESGASPSETYASSSTINRWYNEFMEKGTHLYGALRSLLLRVFNIYVNELQISDAKISLALRHLLHQFPPMESSKLVLGDSNIWLTQYLPGEYI